MSFLDVGGGDWWVMQEHAGTEHFDRRHAPTKKKSDNLVDGGSIVKLLFFCERN